MSKPTHEFHPAVADWFAQAFQQPSEVQAQAWPAIQSGANTLIAAPTGSGKTLAAFLAAIDGLIQEGLRSPLPDETRVLYISPLKALSNDINRNLEQPLCGIRDALLENSYADVPVRSQVRTGDTPQAERAYMRKHPPHILVTTPESLYILLTSDSGREMLKTVRSVIVDEIHALAGNKRGAHLMLTLERLQQLCVTESGLMPVRVGISATQKPISDMAHFLCGQHDDGQPRDCTIVDTGHSRERDLAIELTGSPLEAVMANECWDEIYNRLQSLVEQHSTTLIFVNTRRLAERAAAALADRIGEDAVTSHHGSLSREHRLAAEQRLKAGQLRALVATASLELGIDIGDVDLVCQMGSPHAISTFLQRAGRSGHQLSGTPKARLFPLSRDDLVECTAMLRAIDAQQLDQIPIPSQPRDVLAQQIVAEVANRDWPEQALFAAMRCAWPYRALDFDDFTRVTKMLADGFHTRRGRRGAYLHRDAVNGVLKARKNARLTAITNGGAIPDHFDYDVIMQPEGLFIGTLNEDFAFDSMPGDVFQLGNTSYRMLKIEQGRVFVEDAHGQPPSIPFWFGEAPGRSDELSLAVSELRERLDDLLDQGPEAAMRWLQEALELSREASVQMVEYLANTKASLGLLPSHKQIVFERFFDETGDMHFVVHAPFGSRVNKAWGLALRKRFCKQFNFELQAAANEDNLILSLGPTHSFPLEEPAGYLKQETVEKVLIQALLDAPMFPARWRWVTNISLAVPRFRAGKKVPAPFQRNDAEDLVALVFPDQLACFENIRGEREVPEHPLIDQVLEDCLHELMDIDGLKRVLAGIEQGDIKVHTRDLPTPSPMAHEILNARPYAFLDDTPAEERRALAVKQRRPGSVSEAADMGRLDTAAIDRVKAEAMPDPRDAEELHDALNIIGFMEENELGSKRVASYQDWLQQLGKAQRATRLMTPQGNTLWVVAERLQAVSKLFDDATLEPPITAIGTDSCDDRDQALVEVMRSRLECLGPVTARELAAPLHLEHSDVQHALDRLQQQGFAIQGRFDPRVDDVQWCERGLLSRIHRYTLKQLRSEIEPVNQATFMRFLFDWQGLAEPAEGAAALERVMLQLEGLSLPAGAWESAILPARLQPYFASDLDELTAAGKLAWLRLHAPADTTDRRRNPAVKTTPIAFIYRPHLMYWCDSQRNVPEGLSSSASKVMEVMRTWGASFFEELLQQTGLLRAQLETALGELVAWGLVHSDQYQGLRAMIRPMKQHSRSRHRTTLRTPLSAGGRWSLIRPAIDNQHDDERIEHIARTLLTRYGVVFRKLLEREQGLPSWRELLYVYRRLEARGELRGGRFVQGFAGEQFALPEAVSQLKQVRRQQDTQIIAISCADPLNLTGIVTPGKRVPAQATHRILYRDGVPVATSQNGEVQFEDSFAEQDRWQAQQLLRRPLDAASYQKPSHGKPN